MVVRIINVRTLRTPEQRAGVVYVGRAFAGWRSHPLGNPFRPNAGVRACLDRYCDWLRDRPTLDADLAALWEETGRGEKPLGCWCIDTTTGDDVELCCHAQILGAMLVGRFQQEATR